jgi:hypothetical protein
MHRMRSPSSELEPRRAVHTLAEVRAADRVRPDDAVSGLGEEQGVGGLEGSGDALLRPAAHHVGPHARLPGQHAVHRLVDRGLLTAAAMSKALGRGCGRRGRRGRGWASSSSAKTRSSRRTEPLPPEPAPPMASRWRRWSWRRRAADSAEEPRPEHEPRHQLERLAPPPRLRPPAPRPGATAKGRRLICRTRCRGLGRGRH